MRSIETTYNRTTYRSRTEARWAVLFDLAGLEFQYEPEGYKLESGSYVPDFWLPQWQAFFEVKPESIIIAPGYFCHERSLGEDLAMLTGHDVIFGCGSPTELMKVARVKQDGIPPAEEWLTDLVSAHCISHAKAYRFDWNPSRPNRAASFGTWRSLSDYLPKFDK